MASDFEDPRKAELRTRVEQAADAAGYVVDADRTPVQFAADSGLNGGIKADVVAEGTDQVRRLFFVRLEGDKPLPGWIRNHVTASASMADVEVFVVVEKYEDQLKGTCATAGAGLLMLRPDNTLEQVLAYSPPDATADKKAFDKRLKEVRRRLDTKLALNKARLETNFQESYAVTAMMEKSDREKYLTSIESLMVAWNAWGDEVSEQIDAASASENGLDLLKDIEAEILNGPSGV
jgi:hypothetical protein